MEDPPQEIVDYFRKCLEERVTLERKKLQDVQDAIDFWEKNTKDLFGGVHVDEALHSGLNTLHRKCAYGVLDASERTDDDIRRLINRIKNELDQYVILKYR